jgi:hypothetical protein
LTIPGLVCDVERKGGELSYRYYLSIVREIYTPHYEVYPMLLFYESTLPCPNPTGHIPALPMSRLQRCGFNLRNTISPSLHHER